MLAAALWGFAEATVFFIVPDVLLSVVALRSLRRALAACLAALAGALAGGALMYRWGATDPASAREVLDAVPAVSADMLERVRAALDGQGLAAVVLGPLTGTPYKTYAVEAGAGALGAAAFLAVSIPARLGRFVLVTLAAGWLARRLPAAWSPTRRTAALLAAWAAFYAAYLGLMPG